MLGHLHAINGDANPRSVRVLIATGQCKNSFEYQPMKEGTSCKH